MVNDWLDKVGAYTVERHEIKRAGGKAYYPTSRTGIGVLHTTEGRGVNNAVATLLAKTSPSHFVVGENRIVQCRPLSAQAASLRAPGNTAAQVQIEMVCFSQTFLWLPIADVLEPMLALMKYLAVNQGIPLVVPVEGWKDDGSDIKTIWASNNTRRRDAVTHGWWGHLPGWWMHLEVPYQAPTWHYDCGALMRREMLRRAAI